MPLNLSINDGDFTPYIKYNAKAGRWYVKTEAHPEDIEVNNPRLAFDFANIKTGWIYYAEGIGPQKAWDSNGQTAPRPAGTEKWKRGFEVHVFGNDELPGVGKLGLREFSSTASNVIAPILQMYDAYEKGVVENVGKVPFFACVGVKPITGSYGTNYEPMFELKAWIDRAQIPAFDEILKGQTPSHFPPGDQPEGPADFGPTPDSAPDLDDEIPF